MARWIFLSACSSPVGRSACSEATASCFRTRGVAGAMSKVAVTARSWSIVTTQGPVPVQSPPQPVKVEPASGVAVSVTAVPDGNEAEHVAPQSIPVGELVTVPEPDPAFVTVSVGGPTSKVAVTARSWSIVTTQGPVPVQSPPQPVNVEPASGVAVSVTAVPDGNDAEHVAPQSIPAGELVTVPEPDPAFVTVSVRLTPTNPSASTAKLVATIEVKSSRPSTGQEPSTFCCVHNRSTTFAYQFDGSERSCGM